MIPRGLTVITEIGDVPALEWGRGGTPVLLVHGAGANAASWAAVADCLPELHLVAVDLRGHGLSHLRNADSEQYWRDLGAVVQALQWEAPVLVGHSLGGYAVTAAAASGVVSSAGLVVLDGFVPDDRKTVLAQQSAATSAKALAAYEAVFRYGWVATHEEVTAYIDGVVRDRESDPLFAGVSPDLIRGWLRRSFVPRGERLLRVPDLADVVAFSTVSGEQPVVPCRDVYAALVQPTLLALAERGFYADAEPALREIEASFPAISLVRVPCGHNMIGTHPGVVADLIRRMVHQTASTW